MYAPCICSYLSDGRTDYFSLSILPSTRNLFILGDFNCHHPLWDSKKVLPTPVGRKYSTGSFLLTSSSMTLTFPLLSPLSLFPFPGRCFRTWVLITYQYFYLPFSLWSFAPMSVPLPSIFRKLAGMALPPTLTLTVLPQKNTRLFLFLLLLLSLPLWH